MNNEHRRPTPVRRPAPWVAQHPLLTVIAAAAVVLVVLVVGMLAGLPAGWWGGLAVD